MKFKRIIVLFLVSVLAMSLLPGCKGSGKNTAEGDDYVTVIKDKEDSIRVPKNFPEKIFPIYKKGKVIAASQKKNAIVIMISSKDDIKKVVKFYKGVLKKAKVVTVSEEDKSFYSAGTLKGYTYTITISENKRDTYPTVISMVVAKEE